MRRLALAAALAALAATPAMAALKEGSKAPDFNAPGFQAGKPITFSMTEARKKGPVVLYRRFGDRAGDAANRRRRLGVVSKKVVHTLPGREACDA